MASSGKYLADPPQVDTGYGYDQGPPIQQPGPLGPPAPAYPGGAPAGPPAPAYTGGPPQGGPAPGYPMGQMGNTTNVVIVNQQPVASNRMILGPVCGHRDWNTDLFACFNDTGGCIWTCCCTPCVLAEISTKLGENACLTCCVPGATMTLRTRTRTLGGIQGSICKDCCAMSWCYLCAICQMSRELTAMGL